MRDAWARDCFVPGAGGCNCGRYTARLLSLALPRPAALFLLEHPELLSCVAIICPLLLSLSGVRLYPPSVILPFVLDRLYRPTTFCTLPLFYSRRLTYSSMSAHRMVTAWAQRARGERGWAGQIP